MQSCAVLRAKGSGSMSLLMASSVSNEVLYFSSKAESGRFIELSIG